jgi:hypothetical protein
VPVGSSWRGPSPSGNPKTSRERIGYAATREAAMAAFARAAGVKGADRPAGGSIQNGSSRLLISQRFLPRSVPNRHSQGTLRTKRFSTTSVPMAMLAPHALSKTNARVRLSPRALALRVARRCTRGVDSLRRISIPALRAMSPRASA